MFDNQTVIHELTEKQVNLVISAWETCVPPQRGGKKLLTYKTLDISLSERAYICILCLHCIPISWKFPAMFCIRFLRRKIFRNGGTLHTTSSVRSVKNQQVIANSVVIFVFGYTCVSFVTNSVSSQDG